jgi:hypothetical protein
MVPKQIAVENRPTAAPTRFSPFRTAIERQTQFHDMIVFSADLNSTRSAYCASFFDATPVLVFRKLFPHPSSYIFPAFDIHAQSTKIAS